MSKKLQITKRPDGKYVAIKFPSRLGSVWITYTEYLTLQQLINSGDDWNKASANLLSTSTLTQTEGKE